MAGEPKNPTKITLTSPDHAKVTHYEVDILDSAGVVLQTLAVPVAQTAVVGGVVTIPLKLYPLTPGLYTTTVRAVSITGGGSGSMASPDNTKVPPAASITDATAHVWTIGVGNHILRDGVDSGGQGTVLCWAGGKVYTLGTDSNWWEYQEGYGWVNAGATDPSGGASPVITANTITVSGTSAPSNAWERAPIAVY